MFYWRVTLTGHSLFRTYDDDKEVSNDKVNLVQIVIHLIEVEVKPNDLILNISLIQSLNFANCKE